MSLALDDQICFALYAAHRAVQRVYRPLLERLGLTYTQYLVMLVLWEREGLSVRELGARLRLDSGTLTPTLKRMTDRGWVRRARCTEDGRVVRVHLTDAGRRMRAEAEAIPGAVVGCFGPDPDLDPVQLKTALERVVTLLEEPS